MAPLLCLLPLAPAWAQQTIPSVDATTLDNARVVLPIPAGTKPLIVLVTFSHKGSDDVAAWNKAFRAKYETDPRVDYYELADLQSAPSLIVKMIVHSMRGSVQEPERAHLAPIFVKTGEWKKLANQGRPPGFAGEAVEV